MSDTSYPQERASPKANDDTGFDHAVESLKKSLSAPIERYFAATEDERDVIALMLANIRANNSHLSLTNETICDGVPALFGGDRKSLLWGLCPTYTVTYNIMEIRILKLILNISCIFNNKLVLAVVS